MKTYSLLFFSSFLVTSLFFTITNLSLHIGHTLASRLVVVLSILPALLILVNQRLKRLAPIKTACPRIIKAKLVSVSLFLFLLLVYSHVMSQISLKPFSTFSLDYLISFPFILLFLPSYLKFTTKRFEEQNDEYALLGFCLMGEKKFLLTEHKELILKSIVKIFFIPIMVGGLFEATEFLLLFYWTLQPLNIITGLFFFGLAFDLTIASVGYVFASKFLGTDAKSTDSTFSGWLTCLICYPPLLVIYQLLAKQLDNFLWYDWLTVESPIYWIWATAIVGTWVIYWLSTAQFGWYFSNLSWRKLIATGPYRYSKHPAYIAKNVYWWMHTVPFYGVSSSYELYRNLLGMLFVSGVYYLRAKTEERHLMQFPEYQAYAKYIATKGILARLKQLSLYKLSKK